MQAWKAVLSAAAVLVGTGIAHAGVVNLSSIVTGQEYLVGVWTDTGTDVADLADLPKGNPNAVFEYTGNIDFQNNAPNNGSNAALNTFADFGFSTSNISHFNGSRGLSESAFLDTTMSLAGFQDNSYLAFVGAYSADSGTTVTVSHDDGASLYTLGADYTANTVFSNPDPTSEVPNSGTLPAGQDAPLLLTYVESNGSPSDLIATVSETSSVPEPGSLALFAAGLLGVGAMLRRRKAL